MIVVSFKCSWRQSHCWIACQQKKMAWMDQVFICKDCYHRWSLLITRYAMFHSRCLLDSCKSRKRYPYYIFYAHDYLGTFICWTLPWFSVSFLSVDSQWYFHFRYGEGWDFGEVANNGRGINASQFNLFGAGIGRCYFWVYSNLSV